MLNEPKTTYLPRFDLWLLLIAIVAIGLRIYRPGLYHLNQDEMNLLFWGLQVGRKAEWIWLSNNWIGWAGGSWIPFTHHSPLNNYLVALPYLFTPNPVFVRGFIGLLSGIGVIFVYLMMRRYFKPHTAIIAGLLLAVSNPAVYWSRFVFHPMGQVFIALWVATGMLAYFENKPRYQVLHLVSLALAIQFHPANALLMPISGLLLLLAFIKHPHGRKKLIIGTTIGTLISAATFLPWLYGTFNRHLETNIADPSVADISTEVIPFDRVVGIYKNTVGARSLWFERENNYTDVLLPPLALEQIATDLQPWLVLISTIAVLALVFRRKWSDLPSIYLGLIAILPLLLARLVSATFYDDWYFVMLLFGAIPAFAIVLGYIAEQKRIGQIMSYSFVGLLIFIHLWMNFATFQWMSEDNGDYLALRAPMGSLRNTVQDMSDELPDDGEVIIIIDELYGRYNLANFHIYIWSIVSEGFPAQVIPRYHNQGIPVKRDNTSILFSGAVGSTIPTLTDDIVYFESAINNEEPYYQKALFRPDVNAFDYEPRDIDRFTTGAHILGAIAPSQPVAGQPWEVVLIWESLIDEQTEGYQFSLRLEDEQGNRIAQQDLRSLDPGLWRTGDIIYNPFVISIPDDFDEGTPIFLQLLMYNFATGETSDVLNADGQPVGQWIYLD